MARRLVLMRHAKSDWANHNLADHDRPLNERGRLSATQMAKHFANTDLAPSVIIASTAARVRETLTRMLAEWPYEPEVSFEQSLYLASVETLNARVCGLHHAWQSAMIVGHNPGLADFVSRLANRPLEMPTAAVAVFSTNLETWTDAVAARDWQLTAHWRPRDLFE